MFGSSKLNWKNPKRLRESDLNETSRDGSRDASLSSVICSKIIKSGKIANGNEGGNYD